MTVPKPGFSNTNVGPVSIAGVIGGILLLFSLPVQVTAHHSAACCDFANPVSIEGVVKTIDVVNPHTKLVLVVMDSNGASREIAYEGHSRNNIYRRGWRPGMVKAGDRITISIAPVKTGGDGGYVLAFKLPDGREF